MPKANDDLFRRLRRAGVRKPVAKTLSELTEDAGKKAAGAGHRAVAELRALADEIEKRLPASTPAPKAHDQAVPVTAGRRRTSSPATETTAKKASAARPRKTAGRPTAAPASSAPRGENKAKILAALKAGPRTASEVSQETGIASATVSAALNRLTKSGEVAKATRGYALPG